jgi:hypothetical protein
MVEHYKDYNPYMLLAVALGQPRHSGLVLPEYATKMSAMERELSRVDDTDKEYLHKKRVHELPTQELR